MQNFGSMPHTNQLKSYKKQIEEMFGKEILPEDCNTVPDYLLDKNGSMKNVNKYRGISLLRIADRILSLAILERLESQVEHKISENQCGFRKVCSTEEQIHNLKTVIKYFMLRSKHTGLSL